MAKSAEISLLVTAESDLLPGLKLAARVIANNDYEVILSVVSDNPPPLVKHVMQRLEELGETATHKDATHKDAAHKDAAQDDVAQQASPQEGIAAEDTAAEDTAAEDIARRFHVESLGTDCDELIARMAHRKGLRLLLLPGLSQLNDNRLKILRKVHAHVVCFEAHPSLANEPQRLWLLGDESGQGKAADEVVEPTAEVVDKPDAIVKWLCGLLQPADDKLRKTTLELLNQAAKAGQDEGTDPAKAAASGNSESDWVIIAATSDSVASAAKLSRATVEAAIGPVLLVRREEGWYQRLTERVAPKMAAKYIPQMDREARRDLAQDLSTQSTLNFEFVALICASTFLASFGLVQDSAAVIIGAMLVAPLMTPILGAGLSLAQGNRPLFLSSLRTVAIGFLAATTTSACFGVLIRITDSEILHHNATGQLILTHEIWSRTSPSIIDFLVGLVGGSAAAFARTRTHLSSALSGAAIAAALVPPIATAGLQISLVSLDIAPEDGTAVVRNLIYGPILLFLANMLTIMIGSSFVLWATGIRSRHDHTNKERWATRTMVLLMLFTVAMAVWITQH